MQYQNFAAANTEEHDQIGLNGRVASDLSQSASNYDASFFHPDSLSLFEPAAANTATNAGGHEQLGLGAER